MFSSNMIALLFVFACVYYVVAGVIVYNVDKTQKHRKRYLVTKLCLASWSLSNGMMIVAADKDIAVIFWALGFISFCTFLPTWIDFLSLFTEFSSKIFRIVLNCLYAMSTIVALYSVLTVDVSFISTNFGYQFSYVPSYPIYHTLGMVVFSASLIMYLQLRWIRFAKNRWHRKQAILFAVLTAAIAPPAIAIDLIIPAFMNFTIVPLAGVLILFITIPLNKVIREQRLLNITATDIAEDLFSSVNQPILALDYENNIALANKAAEKFWEIDINGKNIADLIYINGKHPEPSLFDEDFNIDDGVAITSDGIGKSCSILLSVIKDKNSGVLSKIIIFNDISELRDALYKANEANRAKTDFLARMSHEIRTPMNAVIGLTDLALKEDNLTNIKEHIFTVKQAGSTLLALINDILDFSKIEANKVEIMSDNYSLSTLIGDVVSLIRMRLVSTGLQFVVNVDSNIPHTLYGDEMRIRQAILNILSNAVKYTERGHISLSIYMLHDDDSILPDDIVNLVIEVKDTGRGIKPDDIDELNQFAVFTQFDVEKNKNIEGVGLGLAITKSIIDMMGGQISVESEYGKGSTFKITLPQKTRTRTPLVSIKDLSAISVLIYERRSVYSDSLAWSLDNLNIRYDFAESEPDLYIKLRKETYKYLFISYELYKKSKRLLKRPSENTTVVVLAEFGEMVSLEDVKTIALPVYCTSIADTLCGVRSNMTHTETSDTHTDFTAPDAKILVVDDVRTNLKVTEGILKPYGAQIALCDNGAAAIKAVQYAYNSGVSEQYDLIFMDHKMPGIDGIEATKRIRALSDDDYYKNVPIIALTANAVVGMEEIFIENGFNGFLSKPINMVKLNVILEKWISDDKKQYIR